MAPRYSIITTCKGRLHNLKRTLPEFLKQENAEVIVVDYDCPDGTSEYVSGCHPSVREVVATDKPSFNASHARNLGAAQACGDFLVFLDADVVVTANFLANIDSKISSHSFALFGPPAQNSLRGSCVVSRETFERIGGYDELLSGYEGEDLDLYMRLRLIGAKKVLLDPIIVREVIEQSMEERVRFRDTDLKMQFLRGQLYLSVKEMVMSSQGVPVLELSFRQDLLAEVNRNLGALYTGEQDFVLEVTFPDRYKRGLLQEWEFSSSISVKARRKKTQ